jgi:hypothetical protein
MCHAEHVRVMQEAFHRTSAMGLPILPFVTLKYILAGPSKANNRGSVAGIPESCCCQPSCWVHAPVFSEESPQSDGRVWKHDRGGIRRGQTSS